MEASSSGSFSCNLSSGRIGLRDGLLRWRLELCAGLLRQGSRFVSAFSVNSSRSALWGRPAPPVLLLRRRAGGVFVAREEDERARRVSSSAEEWRRGRPDLRAGEEGKPRTRAPQAKRGRQRIAADSPPEHNAHLDPPAPPAATQSLLGSMEDSNLRGLVGEEIFMEAGKTAGIGLAAGSVWGALVSVLYDGPQVGSNGKYPQLIRTGKVCGHYAANFAIIGGTYVGVEQALEKYRMKKDIFNGVAASFATGAAMGLRVRSSRTALLSGSAIALTSVLLDVTGMRTTDEEKKGHHQPS